MLYSPTPTRAVVIVVSWYLSTRSQNLDRRMTFVVISRIFVVDLFRAHVGDVDFEKAAVNVIENV